MPVRKDSKGKYRVLTPEGKLARGKSGEPVDGGGFATRAQAEKQIQAIAISKRSRGK